MTYDFYEDQRAPYDIIWEAMNRDPGHPALGKILDTWLQHGRLYESAIIKLDAIKPHPVNKQVMGIGTNHWDTMMVKLNNPGQPLMATKPERK